jgi:hypothetical protein
MKMAKPLITPLTVNIFIVWLNLMYCHIPKDDFADG